MCKDWGFGLGLNRAYPHVEAHQFFGKVRHPSLTFLLSSPIQSPSCPKLDWTKVVVKLIMKKSA